MFRIVLFLLMSYLTIYASSKCSDIKDLAQHNGHYYGISSSMMTFDEAKRFAENKGGYLAIPNNAAENIFLKGMIGGNRGAWIGVHDPNYNTNYSYSEGQKKNPARFVDIKGKALSYSNWESSQPDNLIKENDTYNGQQRVSPLGEHWVKMYGNSGKWWDYGNHFGTTTKEYALMEFETMPTCFEDLSSNVTDTFTNKKCTTQIWDDKTGNVETGTIFDCRTDSYGNTYCPSALSECGQEFDYENGYSVSGLGQVVDYTLKEKQYKCPSDNYLLASKYYDSCSWCHDITYYEVRCSTNGTLKVMHEFRYKGSYAYAGGRLVQNYNQSNINSNIGKTYLGDIGQGCNYLVYYSRTCDGINCNYNFSINSNCNGSTYSTSTVAPIPYIYSCPTGYSETTGSETSKGACKRTIEYTYYNYMCSGDKNAQDYNYIPQDTGGNCNKTDPSNTTVNPNLGDACNSATPPTNNCKREKFMCQANRDRPCSYVDNKWQCSPYPCWGGNDIEPEGDIEGANDKDNNGWNEDGTCSGQIYIFNGKDRRCRSWDMFFGLAGGGCCNKEKVFLGLIDCKANEKLLAKQNKAELCTEVGEYCSKKLRLGFTKICIQKSKGHCCFGSKLARFVHEQGRPQIGIEWGSPESPQCRGFTPEEFQKLDFSKIDLTGAFDIPEIKQSDLTNKINSTVENFKNMLGNGKQ